MAGVKYTGKDLEITMGSTAITCNNIRSVTVSEKVNTVDTTGACDTFLTFLATRRDVDVTIEVLDSTVVNEVFGLFGPSTSGQTLIIYPQGNSTGKPKLTCTAFIITGRDRSIGYNDVVAVTATGKASAGFVEATV
jgi:hypothetical protein